MTADQIIALVNPWLLVHFDEPLIAANGETRVPAGTLAAVRLRRFDSWGYDLEVFDSPTAAHPCVGASPNDLVDKVRPMSADEERQWVRLATEEAIR
jgi:hypothetical protein